MANTHYARFVFPIEVFERHEAIINELFPEEDWPEGGSSEHTMEFVNSEAHGTAELEAKLDTYMNRHVEMSRGLFAYYARFADGMDFEDHESLVVIANGKVESLNNEPLELGYDPGENEMKISAALAFLRLKSVFDELCGLDASWTSDLEHIHGETVDQCPNCGSSNIEGDGVDVRSHKAVQEVSCVDCGCDWDDVYRRSGLVYRG